jgi:phosphoribosylanthranilate isomerase
VKIKICGLTEPDDALAAVEAGASMLGFNFYEPSPRSVSPGACARIQAVLANHGAHVTTVGVFVNMAEAGIRMILDDCGLDLAQLHGDETPELLAALGDKAFKAIRPVTSEAARVLVSRYLRRDAAHAPALLVDAAHPSAYGGTGQVADWPLAASLAAEHPILLAGGLCPENVGLALAQVHPWGVDVASGVESRPGKKDRARMTAFIDAVYRHTAPAD